MEWKERQTNTIPNPPKYGNALLLLSLNRSHFFDSLMS